MALIIDEINIGTAPDDGTGDLLRDSFDKTNKNFEEVKKETLQKDGSITMDANYVPLDKLSLVTREYTDSISSTGLYQFDYTFKSNITSTPLAGEITLDDADLSKTTKVYINKIDKGGHDMSMFIEDIAKDDYFNIYDSADAGNFVSFDVTGVPVLNGDVYEIPVTQYEYKGTIATNTHIYVHWKKVSELQNIMAYQGTIQAISEIKSTGIYDGKDIVGSPTQGNVIITVKMDASGNMDLSLKDGTSRIYEGGKPAGGVVVWKSVSPEHLVGLGVPSNSVGHDGDFHFRMGSDKIYVKAGGVWSDITSPTPDNMEYDGVIATDTDKTRYLVNKLAVDTHKAPTHSGSIVTLSGDGKVEVPINFDGTNVHGAVTFFNGNTKEFEQVGVDGVGSKELLINSDFSDGFNGWELDPHRTITLTGNVVTIKSDDPGTGTYGIAPEPQTPTINGMTYYASHVGRVVNVNTTTGDCASIRLVQPNKTIQYNNNSFIKHGILFTAPYDILKYISRSKGDSEIEIKDISLRLSLPKAANLTLRGATYGTIVKLHTNHFSQADLDAFTAEPELLIEWALGTKTIPSGITKSADDKIYQGLKEITDGTVLTPSGTNTTSNLSQFGIQALKLATDASGKVTGISTHIEGKDDGRFIQLPMVDAALQHHEVKVCLEKIAGDITQIVDTPCTP